MGFSHFLQWLSETPFSDVIRGSVWVQPLLETIHLLTLTVFFGFVVVLDLRLLGLVLVSQRVTEVHSQLNRWLYVAFATMICTGVLLFSGDPVSFWDTVFFKTKMCLLFAALLNIGVFNWTVGRRASQWDLAPDTPLAAKAAAIISLTLWVAIIAAGRGIAYAVQPPA